MEVKTGAIVRANHRGEDKNGRILDYTTCRGRVVSSPYFLPGNYYADKPVVDVMWFADARDALPRQSFVSDLVGVG